MSEDPNLPAPRKLVINPIVGATKGVPIVVSGLFLGRSAAEPLSYSLGGPNAFGLGAFKPVQNVLVREWATTIVPRHVGRQSIVVTDGVIFTVVNFCVEEAVI